MDPLRALRERIVAEPDDVGLRRVYADMLVARCDPRGELIHLQCALAERQSPELLERERELLERYLVHWSAPIGALDGTVKFVRGFVEEWSCSAEHFISRGARVVRSTPLRRVRLLDVSKPQLYRVLSTHAVRGVRELEVRGLQTWPFFALASCPSFTRLERLVLSGTPSSGSFALSGMISAPWFARVRELELDLPVSDDDRRTVREAMERFPSLRVWLPG